MTNGEYAELDAIISALYECISGPAGEPRDWDRFRTLFKPEAHLIRTGQSPEGEVLYEPHSVETFIRNADPYFKEHSFFETEIARHTESFGNIAHVLSTYEAHDQPDNPQSHGRGINSIQLTRDGQRWWVVNMIWDDEREGNPIPISYLP
ncbi:hypothetical protein ACFL4U_02545 [Candidatus Neomarinimicrobiota bacterium]